MRSFFKPVSSQFTKWSEMEIEGFKRIIENEAACLMYIKEELLTSSQQINIQ